MTSLSRAQRRAIKAGSPRTWLGCREVGVSGDTMAALERRGLAEVRQEGDKSYGRCLYRLTAAGNELRVEWCLDELAAPVEHQPVHVRCTHCGAEFDDGTIGGSCGRCLMTVEAA